MKKRIGSRNYDTETAEYICDINGGQLYRKKTRGREWFAAFDSGGIKPLDVYDPFDQILMETGHIPEKLMEEESAPAEYRVRLDQVTYEKISEEAKRQGVAKAEIVRQLAENL